MGISAVIITKNEEKNIGRCLDSLVKIADEIIVVDSHSTDKTKEIVNSYPNTTFHACDWLGHAKTKNFANSLAQHSYILSLDADEALDETLQSNLLQLKDKLTDSNAYNFNRLTNYCGQWIHYCGWYPDNKIRLFPRDQAHWNEKASVHETLQLKPSVQQKHIKGNLLHYSYYSVEEHIARGKVYSTLAAQEIVEKNKSFLILRAIVNPPLRFIKSYFLKLGFLDGFYGLCICLLSASEVFQKYIKARKLQKTLPH